MEQARDPVATDSSPGGRPGGRLLALYRRHERIAPAVFFFAGVGWDAATVFRIDNIIDTVLVVVYLALLGVLVTATALDRAGLLRNRFLVKWRAWFAAAMQFLLGALFSVFVFFYSQSASLTQTSVYLGVLVVLLVANEFLHRRMLDIHLGLGLYYLALASFLVYFIPIVTGRMGVMTFVAGTLLAAAGVLGIVRMLGARGVFASRRQLASVVALITALFAFHQAAYVMNWIPPVPVALREGGIYREVVREGDTYRMRFGGKPWWAFWRRDERDIAWTPGDPVYCFTAVFAPTRLKSRVYHVWEWLDESTGRWAVSDRIGYDISGGRDYGYRGYTVKRLVRPGAWRVRVETEGGRLLSRIPFTVREERLQDTTWTWVTAR